MLTQRQLFLRHVAQTSTLPLALEIDYAEGCYMYDTKGKAYLDLISGISVSSLGHRHPAVTEAIKAQVDKYMHLMVYGEFVQSPQVAYAKALADTLPAGLDTVYFTNSGTEATEGAMKLAKRLTGRTEILSCYNAYHGSSQGALSLAGAEWLKNSFRPLIPGTGRIRFNHFEDIEKISRHTAAVFIEPVQSEAGGIVPATGYLEALRARCTETGTLLVFDEIQTGMGRTGTLWAMEWAGVTPDILLLGKAFGGGMPLGAFIASQERMQALTFDPVLGHITTFGGHPVSCASGLATLQVLLGDDIITKVAYKENLFRQSLQHANIKAINGKGLLLAMELENFAQVQQVIRHAENKGMITDWFLFNDHSVRIAPPLIISEEEIEQACSILLEAVDKL